MQRRARFEQVAVTWRNSAGDSRGPGWRRTMTTRRSRRWLAITVGAVLALVAASTVSATMYVSEKYAGEDAYSYDDCGFWIDVAVTFSGTAHIRTGKGKDATA